MARFVRRYTLIDHHKGQMREVGQHFVLNPAKNPADYAAMLTLAENVDPEMAADIYAHLAMIDKFPDRQLGGYGRECLKHIKHPVVKKFADEYARRNGIT